MKYQGSLTVPVRVHAVAPHLPPHLPPHLITHLHVWIHRVYVGLYRIGGLLGIGLGGLGGLLSVILSFLCAVEHGIKNFEHVIRGSQSVEAGIGHIDDLVHLLVAIIDIDAHRFEQIIEKLAKLLKG